METKTPLPRHIRIAALQCDFEGGFDRTLRVPALWQDYGFNVEQLFHTHAEMYSAVFDAARHGERLRRYIAESRARGIEIVLYMNCHILLDSQADRAEAWAQRKADGSYHRPYGTYYGCCLNSPWTDYFLDKIGELRGYDIRGLFLDGPSAALCYCPVCRAKFEAAAGAPMDGAPRARLEAFRNASRMEFMRRVYARIKSVDPAWISYINMGVFHTGASAAEMPELLALNDWVGTEGGFQFYGDPSRVPVIRCGLSARMLEAVAPDKPRIIFMAGDHKPWSWYLHTPAETRLCYASALASGASVWYGIHCNTDSLAGETGRAAREMVAFDRRHERLYERTESLANVAVFYSFDTARHYASSGEVTDLYDSAGRPSAAAVGNHGESFHAACSALFRSGIPFDIVTDTDLSALGRYAVVFAPTAACLSARVADALRAYVAGGGTLVADSETALFDEQGRRREDFVLADLLGVSFRGHRRYDTHDYFSFERGQSPLRRDGARYLPAPGVAIDIEPAPGTEVLARLYPPIPGRYAGRPVTAEYPFIVRRATGAGRAYYLAGTFFERYVGYAIPHYRRIVEALVLKHSEPVVRLKGAGAAVEVTVRRSLPGREVLVHLVNYTGAMVRPIEAVTPLRGIVIDPAFPCRGARILSSGKPLSPRPDGSFKLPVLKEFEVVLLETAE